MTRIDFYTEAHDKLQTACRLCAKAVSQQLRVMIYTPEPRVSEQISELLWRIPPTGFIAHCFADDALASETPVIIDHLGQRLLHDEVLLNLTETWPPFFSRFSRLIEIVSESPEDSEAARGRFRFYRDRGYEIHHHSLAKT